MTNITDLTLQNIIIRDCTATFSLKNIAILNESYVVLFNCFHVCMQHITIKYTGVHGGLLAFNILGKFILESIKSEVLRIPYNDSSYTDLSMASTQQNILSIHKFQPIPMVYEVRTTSPNYLDWLTGRTMFDYYWMNRQNPSSCLSMSSYFSPHSIEQDYSTKFIVKVHLLQTSFNISVRIKNSYFKQLNWYEEIISRTV